MVDVGATAKHMLSAVIVSFLEKELEIGEVREGERERERDIEREREGQGCH